MRRLLLAALVVSAACRKAPSYEAYRDPAGFSLEAPSGWPRDPDPAPAGKPVTRTEFIGDPSPQDQGYILGAVLTVTKMTRTAPAKALESTKAHFPDDAATAAESKLFARDYEYGGPTPMHQSAAAVPMHAEGKIFRTPDAFYVVELRAVRSKFEAHRSALTKALATFRPG